ncbi:hypothetical protein ACMBCM_10035, partial [Spiroplasma sp. K1]
MDSITVHHTICYLCFFAKIKINNIYIYIYIYIICVGDRWLLWESLFTAKDVLGKWRNIYRR